MGKKVFAGGGGMIFTGSFSGQSCAIKQIFATMLDAGDLAESSTEVTALSELGISKRE